MGDADNTFPPTKKRAAGRELSRDDPELDDEVEIPGQETGTFKKASDEVLASRRIVKVKRGQTSSTPSAPSSNPFAAICLVPPTNPAPTFPTVNNSQEAEQPVSEKLVGNEESTPVVENKDKLVGNDENVATSEKGDDGGKESTVGKESCENRDNLVGNDENAPAADKEKDDIKDDIVENEGIAPNVVKENDEEKKNIDGNDGNTAVGGSVNSFQQLSSNQNAFTGLVGTGFSNSTFSFGSIQKTDTPIFSSFSFGTNGNSALFGNMDRKTEGTKITPPMMQEVQVETGEENEKAVFTADSVLFEFIDGGWKERGKGELKVNVLTSGTGKARLVMRARGNYRLILNASIFPDMKLTSMEKKGITFACLNSTGEGQNGLSTFALKFKDASVVEEFRSAVITHKGNPTGGLNLKTPENSPKESDE